MEYGFTLDNDLLLSLMPQKMPMLLCEKVMLMTETKECNLGCGFFTVGDRECAVLDECNNFPVLGLIEVMSQAVAGILAYKSYRFENKLTRLGLFLSVRAMKLVKEYPNGTIPKGTLLQSCVEISNLNDGIVSADVKTIDVSTAEEIAVARLTVLSPNDELVEKIFHKININL